MFKSAISEVPSDQRLNCERCEKDVARLLAPLQGGRQVRAQELDQRIEVLIDTTTAKPAALAKHLDKSGYETRVVNLISGLHNWTGRSLAADRHAG